MRRRAAGKVGETSVEVPGGRRYSAGDRVIALTPDPDRRFVTSQRGTVTDIDPKRQAATTRFDGADADVVLAGEQLDHEHVDHGYAVTVHRAQGATVDRAHVDVDGGGRELAYVAMSRAREITTVHCAAEDLEQAVDDLTRDWSRDRRQRWTLDTDLPAGAGQRPRPSLLPGVDTGLRLGRLRAERAAILDGMPADTSAELVRLGSQRQRLAVELHDLQTGTGCHAHTDLGDVARGLAAAREEHDRNEAALQNAGPLRRRRLQATVAHSREVLAAAAERWQVCAEPVEDRLRAEIRDLDQAADVSSSQGFDRRFWELEHPQVARRLEALTRQILTLEGDAGLTTRPLGRPSASNSGLSR